MSNVLSRDAILSVDDIQKELVEVPEWGGAVYVFGLTAFERDQFEASLIEQKGKKQNVNMANIRAKLAAYSIRTAEGKRIFSDVDVPALAKKSAAGMQRIFIVAQRLSGIGDADIEELAGGLEENPLEGSPSA